MNKKGVVNKAFLDTNLSKTEGQLSYIEKKYIEYKLLRNEQTDAEVLIERAVNTTTRILCDEGLFEKYDIADQVITNHLLK